MAIGKLWGAALFAASLGAAGCNSDPSSSPPDPCAGLGCASLPGSLTLRVVDGAGQPVPGVMFSEGGKALTGSCAGGPLDGGACASWYFPVEGSHQIDIAAPGFAPQTLTVEIKGVTGCCGQGDQVERMVTLQPG